MTYKRIPLMIDVIFTREGNMMPRTLIFDEKRFEISKVIKKRRFCPKEVPCVAPIEYTVMIEGVEKKIYFEPDTFMWFSVKKEDRGATRS